MLHKRASELPVFTASDGCELAEVIHPANDGTSPGVSLARAYLPPGATTQPHRLEFLEIYYVVSGQGLMHVDDEAQSVRPGSCVYVPPGSRQWLENNSPEAEIVFLCVCHPAYNPAGDHPA